MEMTKPQLIEWLRRNKPYVKISAIAKASGVSYLSDIVNEYADGHGRPATLPDKHVEKLTDIINSIKK